ncbi:MAG: winged helix-turn-helix domain-containing protein [Solirubrobacteraceae bacterium]
MDQLSSHADYEFAGFRLDTTLQVLVSPAGEVIPLPSRAHDALRYLIERAGELVDKAALMRAVWPNTLVEDNNLNRCILTLRRALGEGAGERRFILTVPGRGFKFVAPVRAIASGSNVRPTERSAPPPPAPAPSTPEPTLPSASQPVPQSTSQPPAQPALHAVPQPGSQPAPHRRGTRLALAAAGSAVLAAVILAVIGTLLGKRGPITTPTEYVPLTDLAESATAPVLSRDGTMLAFIGGGSTFLGTGRIYVKALPDGQPEPLTGTLEGIYGPAFSFDGTRVAFTAFTNGRSAFTNGRSEPAWNTMTVPTTGGAPKLLLGNAAGLTWIAPHDLLYSEIEQGIHMGVVTSTDDRAALRTIYFPAHERGMAHYSYLSPDRRSVLVVEMGGNTDWHCRLVPFDGRSSGERVGPPGQCTSAAWSPDGRWMYFSAQVAGQSHLWRQRYPHGALEQITFGPTEEEGVAVARDGRSLVTSLGLARQSIWFHDSSGERALTSEAVATAPWLSADAMRLYFLAARRQGGLASLWRLDLTDGQQQQMLPGLDVVSYDISPDEREAVFSADHRGERQVWIAPLDHHAPPQLLARDADEPAFDGQGHIFFRRLGRTENHLYRMQDDGSGEQRVLDMPLLEFMSVSPSGHWAAVLVVVNGQVSTSIVELGTGKIRWADEGYYPARWSLDGKFLYRGIRGDSSTAAGRIVPIALPDDAAPPIAPFRKIADGELLPHAIEGFFPGRKPATYVFTRTEWLRNIYRIPLHR